MSNNLAKIIAFSIFVALLVMSFLVIKPFISAILSALILAFIFRPVHAKLTKIVKNKTFSAAIISLIVFIVLITLTLIILQVTARQVLNFYTYTQSTDIIAPLKAFLTKITDPVFSVQISFFLDSALEKSTSFIINSIASLIMDLPSILIQLIVTFFVMFCFVRDGEAIAQYIKDILPFDEKTKEKFFSRFAEITSGTIYGTVIVGIIQGLTAGIGFYLFGVEGAFLLMLMAVILSILPIGPAILWFPAALNFILSGEPNKGIGLLLYGIIVVSYIDNVVRPFFVGNKTKMAGALVLLGMLGGFMIFGIIGFIIGPIILDYLRIFLDLYKSGHLKDILKKE